MVARHDAPADGRALSLCVWSPVAAMVLISLIIPWAVFTRYVLNSASSWPEPAAILL